MRYEVIERTRGVERVITTTRRENGAIAERDIAAESAWRNARKHAEVGGRGVMGPDGRDPNAVVVVYVDADATITWTYTYRRVGRERVEYPDLSDALLASLIAIGATNL